MRNGLAITLTLTLAWAGTAGAQTARRPGAAPTIRRTQYVDPGAPPAAPAPAAPGGPANPYPALTSPYGGGPADAAGTAYNTSGGVMSQPMPGAGMLAPHTYDGTVTDTAPHVDLASDATDTLGTRFYGNLEYLLIWPKRSNLAVTSVFYPSSAVGQTTSGVLQLRTVDPNQTANLFGGIKDGTPTGGFSGIRATLGGWFDDQQQVGGEVVYFVVPERGQEVNTFPGPGTPFEVARTIADPTQGNSSVLFPVFVPGTLSGGVSFRNEFAMSGIEANLRYRGPQVLAQRFDWLAGFRYLRVDETVRVSDSATALTNDGALELGGPPAVVGSTLSTFDSFTARNQFYGPQVGGHARYDLWCDKLLFDFVFKLAGGVIAENVRTQGVTTLTRPGDSTLSVPRGILVGQNNNGKFYDSRWVVIPDLTFNLNYKVTPSLALFTGFNTLFIQQLQRASATIDPFVDPTAVPFRSQLFPQALNSPRPTFRFDNESFWIYGLNVGLQYTY